MASFSASDKTDWVELGGGVRRRIRAYNPELMLVEVGFETGAVGADHTHTHTQISHCLSGEFTYHVEDVEYILHEGDSVAVEGGKLHGTTCLKSGILLDVFTPMREDFIG